MNVPLKISDIAHPDTSTQFISDVQLSTFYDHGDLNRDLMQRFIFTRGSGDHGERRGTADLLKILHQRVTPIAEKEDNRFVFMATYGHGKSHFGLALANYFGALQNSPELQAVQTKLDHVLSADQAQVFRDYREGKAPFMVLILRGDRPGSLRDTFFQALDRALSQSEQIKDVKPPFWFDKADDILERLGSNASYAATANKYLAAHNHDLQSLRLLVKERRSVAFNLAVGAFKAVHGVQPNLGGETALNDAVNWIVTELCGPGKPFGGLLILFDEFSRFVQDYIYNNPTGAPLQEILSGVNDQSAKGKALFVAFSQHDPVAIARKYGGGEELIKELNRLPEPNRHRIQTKLEDVIGSVLKTNESVWKTFVGDPRIGVIVSDAADTARMLFTDRYGKNHLGWDLSTVMEKVAKDCFPLHPLTTAFLASIDLESSAGAPRSILQFIQDEAGYVMPRFNESALKEDGKPNWVLPTRLVDYYKGDLGQEKYKNFESVIKPDLADEQQSVLKAMLLLDIAGLSTKQAGGYAAVIANLAGLEEDEAKRALQTLEEQHYIRYDSANKTYSFWVGSNDAIDLDRMLNEEIQYREQNKKIGQLFENFTGGTNPVNKLPLIQEYPVAVGWGHPDDWAAKEVLVPVSGLNQSFLTALRTKYAVELDRSAEARGVVVLVVPRTQKEADAAAEKINQLLSASEKDKAAPLVFLIPQEAHADLHTNLLKLALLYEPLFKSQAQSKVGLSAINEMWQNLGSRANKSLAALRQNSVIVVPPGVHNAWVARAKPNMANRVGEALKVVYELAYPHHPDSFFQQYKQSAPNLSVATKSLVSDLLENSLDKEKTYVGGGAKKVAEEALKLLQKDWKVISPQRQIIIPEFTKIKVAWDRLDATFSPRIKSAPVGPVLKELLQSPYGYDHNTLALVFAAWYGFNSDGITMNGTQTSRAAFEDRGGYKNPAAFLNSLENAQIHRRDTKQEREEVDLTLSRMRNLLNEATALDSLRIIDNFINKNPKYDGTYINRLTLAADKLKTGLSNLQDYDAAVAKYNNDLKSAAIGDLRALYKRLRDGFPELTSVQSKKESTEALGEKFINRAEELAGESISNLTRLKEIGNYGKQVDGLKALSATLDHIGLTDLKAQAEAGLQMLAQAKEALEASQAESTEVSVVNSISVTGGLAALRASLDALQKQAPKSNKAQELIEKKVGQLKTNIAQLEGQFTKWNSELDGVLDAKVAGKLSKELTEAKLNYDGTPESEQWQAMQAKAEALSRYFGTLGNTVNLRDPADVAGRRNALNALADEYQSVLNPPQRAKVDEALTTLEQQRLVEEEKASQWLKVRQERFTSGEIKGLEKDLDSPPRFLSDAGREALSGLRSALHDKQAGKAQEEQQLALLRSIAHSGSMAALQKSLVELDRITPVSEAVNGEAAKKREKIDAEILRLNALPEKWVADLASATQAGELDELSKDITRNEGYLKGTPHEEKVVLLGKQVAEVQRVFRRAKDLRGDTSTRLRDLAERRTAQAELLENSGLSSSQRKIIEQDVAQTEKIFAGQLVKLDKTLGDWQLKLDSVQSGADLDKIDLTSFPRAGLPEDRLSQLKALEARRDALRPLFNELALLGKQSWHSMTEAQELLRQYTALFDSPQWSETQQQAVGAKRAALTDQLRAKRQEAAAWLKVREEKLDDLDGKGLAKLENELRQPPAFLDGSEHERLSALQGKLHARLEEDQALQIETLFEKIESPQRRAALVERLQQLLQMELA